MKLGFIAVGVVQAVAGTEPTDTTNIVGVVNEEGDRRPPIMDLVDIAASETGVDSFVRRLCDRLDADEPLVKDLPGVCLRFDIHQWPQADNQLISLTDNFALQLILYFDYRLVSQPPIDSISSCFL